MKTHQKLIQIVVALTLLAGVVAFTSYAPDSQDNVAWNSRMSWSSGGGLPMPNVAWNSGTAWVPYFPPANVAWNSRMAWFSGGNLPLPNVAWNSGVAWEPLASPLRVAWNT